MDRKKEPNPDIEELGAEAVPGSGFEDEEPETDDDTEDE
jgi:hypothetical protein